MLGLLPPPVQPCLVHDDAALPLPVFEVKRARRQAEQKQLLEGFLRRHGKGVPSSGEVKDRLSLFVLRENTRNMRVFLLD